MKKNKIKSIFMSLTAALLIPTSAYANEEVMEVDGPEYAEDGVWTQVGGSSYVSLNTDGTKSKSATYNSTGGDFQVCMSGVDRVDNTYRVTLWEYDSDNADDYVTEGWWTSNGCLAFRGIGGAVDGTYAEFYVQYDMADYYDSSVTVKAYD